MAKIDDWDGYYTTTKQQLQDELARLEGAI
jgi:hypothetical protein